MCNRLAEPPRARLTAAGSAPCPLGGVGLERALPGEPAAKALPLLAEVESQTRGMPTRAPSAVKATNPDRNGEWHQREDRSDVHERAHIDPFLSVWTVARTISRIPARTSSDTRGGERIGVMTLHGSSPAHGRHVATGHQCGCLRGPSDPFGVAAIRMSRPSHRSASSLQG
jgi:hypothetical protein